MSEDGNNLFAIAFDDEYKANEARLILRRAQGEGLIELVETAVVVKGRDGKARLSQDTDTEASGRTKGHWLGIAAAWVTGTVPFIMAGTDVGHVAAGSPTRGLGPRS
jgi:uncharacterized membrane protein